jgi:H+-transporting ATPase
MGTRALVGLTTSEADEARRKFGPNRVEEARRRPIVALRAKLSGPVPWMLEASLVLEAVLRKWIEAAIIAVLLVLNAVLAFSKEQRAQNALLLLRPRLSVLARVKRDGSWRQVRAEEVVPGDLLHVRMTVVVSCYAFVVAESVRAFSPSPGRTRRDHALHVAA